MSYTGSGGYFDSGQTRIHYYIENGTKAEAQRVLLVMGKCASLGMSTEGVVSWSRSLEGHSRESPVRDGESVWIVWEDDTVQAADVGAVEVASMIHEWSDDQAVPETLQSMIKSERAKKP